MRGIAPTPGPVLLVLDFRDRLECTGLANPLDLSSEAHTYRDIHTHTTVMLILNDIALPDKSSQSYEASLSIWDYTVLPVT